MMNEWDELAIKTQVNEVIGLVETLHDDGEITEVVRNAMVNQLFDLESNLLRSLIPNYGDITPRVFDGMA